MDKLKHLWSIICHHKYAITIALFLLIICFIDENSLVKRIQHWREIRELKAEIEQYKKQYENSNATLKSLTSNPEELEKIAREKYLMKEKDEDIYIFEDDLETTPKEIGNDEKSN